MRIAVVAALTMVLAHAQQGAPGHHERLEIVFARVPAKARAAPNPLAGDPQAAAAGHKLFEQHCAQCHGAAAQGARRGPSLRQPRIEHATPGELFWILTNGVVRHGMPPWSKLPEPQRWQIIAFLQAGAHH
jgi:mono/diheme cytochrome c family protein